MISIILGTRPEIIKMSPVVRACENEGIDYHILHTGQHYSYEMDRIFFEELELPESDHNLDVGSGTQAEQTGRMLSGIESILLREDPNLVLVQGDTNTVLAGALAASKLHIPIGHVEAGLRSYDRTMPEEINRVLADHLSTHLYAPTDDATGNLEKEGITEGVFVTGNTVVDAAYQNMEISKASRNPFEELGLSEGEYFLVTAHRQENVDSKDRLTGILKGLRSIRDEFDIPVVFPAHPRTQKMLRLFSLASNDIDIINPVGYLDFLQLESGARLVLTDSGGVQEETCILGVPCVTLRENTERPETVKVGSNVLVGTDPAKMVDAVRAMDAVKRDWQNPYGDGKSGERIVNLAAGFLQPD